MSIGGAPPVVTIDAICTADTTPQIRVDAEEYAGQSATVRVNAVDYSVTLDAGGVGTVQLGTLQPGSYDVQLTIGALVQTWSPGVVVVGAVREFCVGGSRVVWTWA